jgi:hypothetical protein
MGRVTVLRCFFALATAACAANARPAGPVSAMVAHSTARAAYVLDATALGATERRTLFEVVCNRWPSLVYGELPATFSSASPGPTARPQDRFGIYDPQGAFLGGPDLLLTVNTSAVRRVVRLTGIEEFAAFGRQHPAGALVVTWAWVGGPGARR